MKKVLGILSGLALASGVAVTIIELLCLDRSRKLHYVSDITDRDAEPVKTPIASDENWELALDEFLHAYNKYQGYLRNDDYQIYSETLEEDKNNAQIAYNNARMKLMDQLQKN